MAHCQSFNCLFHHHANTLAARRAAAGSQPGGTGEGTNSTTSAPKLAPALGHQRPNHVHRLPPGKPARLRRARAGNDRRVQPVHVDRQIDLALQPAERIQHLGPLALPGDGRSRWRCAGRPWPLRTRSRVRLRMPICTSRQPCSHSRRITVPCDQRRPAKLVGQIGVGVDLHHRHLGRIVDQSGDHAVGHAVFAAEGQEKLVAQRPDAIAEFWPGNLRVRRRPPPAAGRAAAALRRNRPASLRRRSRPEGWPRGSPADRRRRPCRTKPSFPPAEGAERASACSGPGEGNPKN